MAKKKDRVPIIKNPKIGKSYTFMFAGSEMYGPIIRVSESLTKQYGYNYYWFNNIEDSPNERGKMMTYPVSIYDILSNSRDV